jgi:glycogen operon protein
MADLVSYVDKHNEANGENNQDGENHNLSWNSGVEGATTDRRILELRARQRRNLMATLMMSIGVPMISGGDESGRTQHGNNNAYCQDNETSWTRWDLGPEQRDFLEFTRRLIRIWKQNPVLRRRKFLQGRRIRGVDAADITWLDASGSEMTDAEWGSPEIRYLGMRLNGDAIDEADERGERVMGDTLLLLFNASGDALPFVLPTIDGADRWELLFDTADPWTPARRLRAADRYELAPHSLAGFRLSSASDIARAGEWGPAGVY